MTKPAWTPGPWRFDNSDRDLLIVVSDGADFIDPEDNTARPMPVLDLTHGGYRFEDHSYPLEGNARLIAAAPELFEALEIAVDAIKDADGGDPTTENGWRSDELLDCWLKGRAALAKAEGRSSNQLQTEGTHGRYQPE